MYEDEHSKFRAYYDQSLKSRIQRERNFAEMSEKGDYDVRTYDQFATRRTAEEHLPFTRYFSSVKENLNKMLEGAQQMALAEAAQAQGYIPWARDVQAYAEAKTKYEEGKVALEGLPLPNRKIGTVWLIGPFIDAMGTLQKHLQEKGIGERTEIDVERGLQLKSKAEQRRERREEARRSRQIDKELKKNAKSKAEMEAHRKEAVKDMPESIQKKYGLDAPERKSVGDKIKDRLQAEKVNRSINKQMKERDKTREEREARQEKQVRETMDEKQRAKYGFEVRERSDDLTRE